MFIVKYILKYTLHVSILPNTSEKRRKHFFQQSKVRKKVSKQKTIITIFTAELGYQRHSTQLYSSNKYH